MPCDGFNLRVPLLTPDAQSTTAVLILPYPCHDVAAAEDDHFERGCMRMGRKRGSNAQTVKAPPGAMVDAPKLLKGPSY